MVMAPEEAPSADQAGVPTAWKWLAMGLLALLAAGGVGIWLLADGDPATEGVGPVGPVGSVDQSDGDAVTGSGAVVSEVRDVSGFDAIVVAGEGTVVVTQGEGFSAALTTDDNLLPLVSTEVVGSALYLDKVDREIDIEPTDGVVLEVAMPAVSGFEITGAGSIEIEELQTDDLALAITGAGSIRVGSLEAVSLSVEAVGVGAIEVAGTVERQDLQLRGVVSYTAPELSSSAAVVLSDGTESAVIWVTELLDITIRDLGSVEYYGEPTVTSTVTGTGQITPLGDK